MSESYAQLYQRLVDSEFECVPAGAYKNEEIYEIVEATYPGLCDDSILCEDVCSNGSHEPEWKHRVRAARQSIQIQDEARYIQYLDEDWNFGPIDRDVASIPDEPMFEVGQKYHRWELHDKFGGQRYTGISTPADRALIFLFTGESGENYGYEDEFRGGGTFLYTGEGVEGDMTMDGGNEAIREHRQHNEELHLFEDTDYPWIVTYVGQYEYVGHDWLTLEDRRGDDRDAIRFRLEPASGTEVVVEDGSPASLSEAELFKKAKQSAPTGSKSLGGTTTSSGGGKNYARSEVVKEFALRTADGVCQGCGQDAPFRDENDEKFLEVHHLFRRSDGGADDPENVIALCPNCHREVHHGKNGDELNKDLIEKAEERNQEFTA